MQKTIQYVESQETSSESKPKESTLNVIMAFAASYYAIQAQAVDYIDLLLN